MTSHGSPPETGRGQVALKHMTAPRRVDKARILLGRRKEDDELWNRYSMLSAVASCPVFLEAGQRIQFSYHETVRCQVPPNTTMLLLILFLVSGPLSDN